MADKLLIPTAEIIAKAIQSMAELDYTGTLGQHVGCAFDGYWPRLIRVRRENGQFTTGPELEEARALVKDQLNNLGLTW
ncbi:hypothetical protein Lumi_108 [Xylophilus phage Lumi]|nr:hypothetical protein Lumi_108 [Xylophilus phage Lumi]